MRERLKLTSFTVAMDASSYCRKSILFLTEEYESVFKTLSDVVLYAITSDKIHFYSCSIYCKYEEALGISSCFFTLFVVK